jgi:hypothetical protein
LTPVTMGAGDFLLAGEPSGKGYRPRNIAGASNARCCTRATLATCAPTSTTPSARIIWSNGPGRTSRAIDLRYRGTCGKVGKVKSENSRPWPTAAGAFVCRHWVASRKRNKPEWLLRAQPEDGLSACGIVALGDHKAASNAAPAQSGDDLARKASLRLLG